MYIVSSPTCSQDSSLVHCSTLIYVGRTSFRVDAEFGLPRLYINRPGYRFLPRCKSKVFLSIVLTHLRWKPVQNSAYYITLRYTFGSSQTPDAVFHTVNSTMFSTVQIVWSYSRQSFTGSFTQEWRGTKTGIHCLCHGSEWAGAPQQRTNTWNIYSLDKTLSFPHAPSP